MWHYQVADVPCTALHYVLLLFSSGFQLGRDVCPCLKCGLFNKTRKHWYRHSQFPTGSVSYTLPHSFSLQFPAVLPTAPPQPRRVLAVQVAGQRRLTLPSTTHSAPHLPDAFGSSFHLPVPLLFCCWFSGAVEEPDGLWDFGSSSSAGRNWPANSEVIRHRWAACTQQSHFSPDYTAPQARSCSQNLCTVLLFGCCSSH